MKIKNIVINIIVFPILIIVFILVILSYILLSIAYNIVKLFIILTDINESDMLKINKKLSDIIENLLYYINRISDMEN